MNPLWSDDSSRLALLTVPQGTADIVWTRGGGANQLPHPGGGASGNLTSCDGSTSAALTARTAYTGTYTYGSNVVAANVDAGTYSLTVTYTATAP